VVHAIRGRCPVHQVGDKIMIDEPRVLVDRTDTLCTHALSKLPQYVIILERKWCPVELGLTTPDNPEHAYMQCVDPREPYTQGRTVTFKCSRTSR